MRVMGLSCFVFAISPPSRKKKQWANAIERQPKKNSMRYPFTRFAVFFGVLDELFHRILPFGCVLYWVAKIAFEV